MKILSKYKDYYDYLTGIYGEDEKLVLDRRKFDMPKFEYWLEMNSIAVYICGFVYEGIYKDHKFYWGESCRPLGRKAETFNLRQKSEDIIYVGTGYGARQQQLSLIPYKDKLELNKKANCPILLRINEREISQHEFPILSQLNFQHYLPAQEIYLMLCEWLSPKDPNPAPLTDKQKIVSAGFDLKTSFRGKQS